MSQPIWTLSHKNTLLSTKNVIKTPFIIQTAKQTVNASVFIVRTLYARPRSFIPTDP